MAWEWSHSAEGIDNVRQNLMGKERDWLAECLAEWRAYDATESVRGYGVGGIDFNEDVFRQSYEDILHDECIGNDVIAEDVFDKASEQRTCTNGGHEAWVCPYGCHMVSFDKE